MNTYTIKNSFTGYTASIRVRGENLPSASTLRRHFRAAKASDCKSSTICRDDQTGERVILTPYGVERIDANSFVGTFDEVLSEADVLECQVDRQVMSITIEVLLKS